jgi:hypothetical protein
VCGCDDEAVDAPGEDEPREGFVGLLPVVVLGQEDGEVALGGAARRG